MEVLPAAQLRVKAQPEVDHRPYPPGAAHDRLDQRSLGRRGVREGLHLDQGLVDHEVRRDHAVGVVALGAIGCRTR